MLVHWGNTNTKHKNSTTAYWADNWNYIPIDRRGNHPCFDPRKDLVLPAWKQPNPAAIWLKLWARCVWVLLNIFEPISFRALKYIFRRTRNNRTTLFYFNGNLGPAYKDGRHEDTYASLHMFVQKYMANLYLNLLLHNAAIAWGFGKSWPLNLVPHQISRGSLEGSTQPMLQLPICELRSTMRN